MKQLRSLLCFLIYIAVGFPHAVFSQEDTVRVPVKPVDLWTPGQPVAGHVLQTTRKLREKLMADPYRPAFHFTVPEDMGIPGDPNGAFYYKGRYHLMYLYNREGRGFSWGHVSSSDLLHWRHHPDAIGPGSGDDGVFSGGAFVDDDGSAYLTFWMLWGAKGLGMAKSMDPAFETWKKFPENPVIKSTQWGITDTVNKKGEKVLYGSADPSNIWKKGNRYYMLTGNLIVLEQFGRKPDSDPKLQGDWLDLLVSDDLKKWEYLHRFYTSDRKWTDKSEDNMCPSFLPLPRSADGGTASNKHLLLFISHNKGCQYYIGDYKEDKFYPDRHGRMSWVDNAFFAPEALVDEKGRQIMWSWVFDDRSDSLKKASGWTGTYSIPRALWLANDGSLGIAPVKEMEGLRMNEQVMTNLKIEADKDTRLDSYSSELMELELEIDLKNASKAGVKVCVSDNSNEATLIYYDVADGKLKVDTRRSGTLVGRKTLESAPLELKKRELLKLRVFIDKSIVEVFANDRQAIARSVYPSPGATGLRLFSEGGPSTVKNLKRWELAPSNPY